jgi:hypothetical protein
VPDGAQPATIRRHALDSISSSSRWYALPPLLHSRIQCTVELGHFIAIRRTDIMSANSEVFTKKQASPDATPLYVRNRNGNILRGNHTR